MFRFNIVSLAAAKKLFQKSNNDVAALKTDAAAVKSEERKPAELPVCNPWQEDLNKLVADSLKRKDVRLEHDQIVQCGVPIDQLMEEKPAVLQVRPQQRKRASDISVSDIKVWWGDALAPWSDHADNDNCQSNSDAAKAYRRWFR